MVGKKREKAGDTLLFLLLVGATVLSSSSRHAVAVVSSFQISSSAYTHARMRMGTRGGSSLFLSPKQRIAMLRPKLGPLVAPAPAAPVAFSQSHSAVSFVPTTSWLSQLYQSPITTNEETSTKADTASTTTTTTTTATATTSFAASEDASNGSNMHENEDVSTLSETATTTTTTTESATTTTTANNNIVTPNLFEDDAGLLMPFFYKGFDDVILPITEGFHDEIFQPVAQQSLSITRSVDTFTTDRGMPVLTYANLAPETHQTPAGFTFLLTNLGYIIAGYLLSSQGDVLFGTLTEIAGTVSVWYHHHQLKYSYQDTNVTSTTAGDAAAAATGEGAVVQKTDAEKKAYHEQVQLALLFDYITACAALVTGAVYIASLPAAEGGGGPALLALPIQCLVVGGLAVFCLFMSWVYEENYHYIFWHSLWHILGAYAGYGIGQAHIASSSPMTTSSAAAAASAVVAAATTIASSNAIVL